MAPSTQVPNLVVLGHVEDVSDKGARFVDDLSELFVVGVDVEEGDRSCVEG